MKTKTKVKRVRFKTDIAVGYGLRVGGPRPYLAWGAFYREGDDVRKYVTEPYHRPMKCVLIPFRDYKKLIRAKATA